MSPNTEDPRAAAAQGPRRPARHGRTAGAAAERGPTGPDDPDEIRPPLRFAEPVASWVALGALLGIVGPGSAIVSFALDALTFGPFLFGSGMVGLVGGALFGVIDPPTRWVPARPRARALLGAVAALSAVSVGGAVWAGLAGAAGSLSLAGYASLLNGQDVTFFVRYATPMGMVLGVGVGAPIVALFGLCRLVAGRWGRPWVGALVGLVLGPSIAAGLALVVFPRVFGPP
jgi:hypothetical protein